jgi:ribosomal protein L7/L12
MPPILHCTLRIGNTPRSFQNRGVRLAHAERKLLHVSSRDSYDGRSIQVLGRAQRAQLQELISQDKKIMAIRLLREWTGLGLKEAKDEVDALAQGRIEDSSANGMPYRTASEIESPRASNDYVQRAQQLIDAGDLLGAIKLVRDETKCSLLEAKNQVESMRRSPLKNDPVARTETTSAGWLVLFLVVIVVAIAMFLNR